MLRKFSASFLVELAEVSTQTGQDLTTKTTSFSYTSFPAISSAYWQGFMYIYQVHWLIVSNINLGMAWGEKVWPCLRYCTRPWRWCPRPWPLPSSGPGYCNTNPHSLPGDTPCMVIAWVFMRQSLPVQASNVPKVKHSWVWIMNMWI